jgi:hypothetical protein
MLTSEDTHNGVRKIFPYLNPLCSGSRQFALRRTKRSRPRRDSSYGGEFSAKPALLVYDPDPTGLGLSYIELRQNERGARLIRMNLSFFAVAVHFTSSPR